MPTMADLDPVIATEPARSPDVTTADKDPITQVHTAMEIDSKSDPKSSRYEHKVRACFRPLRNGKQESKKTNNLDIIMAVKGLATALLTIEDLRFTNDTDYFDELTNFPDSESGFKDYFDAGEATTNGSVNIYFTVKTAWTFSQMKSDAAVWEYLNKHNIFVFYQSFAKVHEMSEIGVMLLKHPKVTNRPMYIKKLTENMQELIDHDDENKFTDIKYHEELDLTSTVVPQFEIYHRVVRHKHDGKEIEADTLQVVTTKDNATWLKALLLTVTKNGDWVSGMFLPFQWRRQESQVFFDMLETHNMWLHNVSIMPIAGISQEVMHGKRVNSTTDTQQILSVYDTLLNLPGTLKESKTLIWCIEPTRDTDRIGKWFLVQHKEHFPLVCEFIDEELPTLCMDTAEFQAQRLQTFRIPRRMTQNQYKVQSDNTTAHLERMRSFMQVEPATDYRKSAKHASTQRRQITQIKTNRQALDTNFPKIPGSNPWSQTKNNNSGSTQSSIKEMTTDQFRSNVQKQMEDLTQKLETRILKKIQDSTQQPSVSETSTDVIENVTNTVAERIRKEFMGQQNASASITHRLAKMETSIKQQSLDIKKIAELQQQQQDNFTTHQEEMQNNLTTVSNMLTQLSNQAKEQATSLSQTTTSLTYQIKEQSTSVKELFDTVKMLTKNLPQPPGPEKKKSRMRSPPTSAPGTPVHNIQAQTIQIGAGNNYYAALSEPEGTKEHYEQDHNMNQQPKDYNVSMEVAAPLNQGLHEEHQELTKAMDEDGNNGGSL
jgi:hypothetical protein